MKTLVKQLTAVFALSLLGSSAFAGVIFEDDFNRSNSNTVGNGWYVSERNNNDVRIRNNHLRLRDFDAAVWQYTSTESYSDIYIDFDWRASYNTEAAGTFQDKLYLSWFDGYGWTDIWETALGGSSFVSVSVGAIAGADNLSDFAFGFYTDVTARNEYAAIDNVVLRGTPTNVSEPGTLALFCLGLAGLGLSRRKLKA